jgi:hypothetical protein
MKIVYYTRHIRDYSWVEAIWKETGGVFCSDLPETAALFEQDLPDVPFQLLPPSTKWTVGRKVGSRALEIKRKARRFQLTQVARLMQPDVIVTTSNFRHAIGRDWKSWLRQRGSTFPHVKQVQAFHGVSSKNVKFNLWMAEFDLLLLPGKRERDKFAALGILGKTEYALIGHPKSDAFLRGELTREAARQRLGLPDRPTVLYAPTTGALSSFFSWGMDICKSVPQDCNFIVKPHPALITTAETEGMGQAEIEAVKNYLQHRGALWMPLEPDVAPLMAASDVLVTDYSSVAEEFLVFDRPIIFVDHLANATGRDRAHRDKGDWEELFSAGECVTDKSTFEETLAKVLSSPGEHAQKRRRLREYVFENLDGHCAVRAAAAIMNAGKTRS